MPPKAHALSDLLRGIKGASARAANKQLGRTESVFWMDESYDRIVRDRGEYDRFLRYLLENPAKARLPADHFWLWPARETGTPPETGKNACPTAERETGIPACPPTPPSNPQAGMPVPPPPSPASSAP